MNQSKTSTKLSFSAVERSYVEIPIMIEKKVTGKDYVYYGEKNDFPQYLWNLYLRSSVMQGIVNGTIDYVCGNEVVSRLDVINREGETIDDLIHRIVADYMIYGGFSIQILRNHLGEISELYWLDVQNIRMNEDGDKIFYSKEWGKYGAKAIEYERFDSNKKQSTSVFYYNGFLSRGVYPIPRYNGALNAIETSVEIGKFHLNNILNNLSSSAIINFNNGQPSEEEKRKIENQITEKFTGAQNAGRFILSFNDNKETATTIERLTEDKLDEKFQIIADSTMQEIFIAFRATPELFGMSSEGNGFSLTEFSEAFELYNKTVVIPIQKDVMRCFDKIYNEENVVSFVPFSLDGASNKSNKENE